jgi:cobalt-zinc-cadmium efflux system outer membrane protein
MNRVDLKSCAEGILKGCDLNAASFECATRMRWVVRLLTLSLLNLTLAAPIAAEEVTALNEQEVLALFFERNLDLISGHYNIDRAEAQTLIASAIPNPLLSLGFNELSTQTSHFFPKTHNVSDTNALGMSVIVTQLIQTNGKRQLRTESSQQEREAVETDFRNLIRVLANTVRKAHYQLLLSQKKREFLEANDQNYLKIVEASRTRLHAGDIAESDLIRVEIEELKIRADVDRAEAALKSAQSELAALLNWPQISPTLRVTERWPDVPSSLLKTSLDPLIEEAYESRPDYRAQELRTEKMETELELSRRLVVPDVTISGGFIQDSGNVRPYTGTFSINAPIPAWYQFQGEVSKAAAELNASRLELEQIRNSIRADVIASHARLLATRAIANRFENESRQRIEKVRDAQEYAYNQGAIGLIDLLDAERTYTKLMVEYYAARTDESIAYADLMMALGEDVMHRFLGSDPQANNSPPSYK